MGEENKLGVKAMRQSLDLSHDRQSVEGGDERG